ncbi:MAG: TraB/GumN family protein [Pseudomonadales bacterium]
MKDKDLPESAAKYSYLTLLSRLIVCCLSCFSTALAAQDAGSESVPVYSASVRAGNGDDAIKSVKVSLNSTHEALREAMRECENNREAALGRVACEPVSIDGEPVLTATELRSKAGQAEEPKLSLFRFNSARGTVYLFGSVHLMKRNAFPLHKSIMAAFAGSDTLVLEVDLGAIDPEFLQDAFSRRGRYESGDAISNHLSKETLSLAEHVLAKRGMTLQSMQSLKPWLFEQMLVTQEMQLYGFDSEAGIDSFFEQKARARNKKIEQLETFEEQLALMSGSSPAEQEVSLKYTLSTLRDGSLQNELNALVIDWLEGDVDGLFETMSRPLQEFPELKSFMVKMFDERNLAMADKISNRISAGGDYFVIVGAGHLGGPNGVVNLLHKKGFASEQLVR